MDAASVIASRRALSPGAAVLAGALLGCAGAPAPSPLDAAYAWSLPAGVAPPVDPPDNPTTVGKVELGRRLFFDRRLSSDGTYACANCHDPGKAFSDGRAVAIGIYGEDLPRGALALANAGYLTTYTWENPLLTSLEAQALVPMLVQRPSELGIHDRVDEVLRRLSADPVLASLFAAAFAGDEEPIAIANVVRALGAYERTLVSARSPYDRFLDGDTTALTPATARGMDLFFSERLGCGSCHSGRWLTDAAGVGPEEAFHNIGLYNLGGSGQYPKESRGLVEFSGRPEDDGRFRTPSLRNVALTAPYMHDGSLPTLGDVIDCFSRGGRLIESEPNAGDGAQSPYKDPRVAGFTLVVDEKADLISFLESLSDPEFVADHRADAGESP